MKFPTSRSSSTTRICRLGSKSIIPHSGDQPPLLWIQGYQFLKLLTGRPYALIRKRAGQVRGGACAIWVATLPANSPIGGTPQSGPKRSARIEDGRDAGALRVC